MGCREISQKNQFSNQKRKSVYADLKSVIETYVSNETVKMKCLRVEPAAIAIDPDGKSDKLLTHDTLHYKISV